MGSVVGQNMLTAGTLLAHTSYTPSGGYLVNGTTLTALDATHLSITFKTAKAGPGSTEIRLVSTFFGQVYTSGSQIYAGYTGTGAPGDSNRKKVLQSNSADVLTDITFIYYAAGLTANTSYTWNLAGYAVGSCYMGDTGSLITVEAFAGLS
ncbi:MAG: hypothetical protein WDN27_02045 [Candidatus Saccharibacteria bacterium]